MDDQSNTLRTMANAVANQVRKSISVYLSRDLERIPRVIEKDGYINQLNTLLEQRTFNKLSRQRIEDFVARYYRGVIRISINLEKIGDYASNIAKQAQYQKDKIDPAIARRFRAMASRMEKGVSLAVESFLQGDWDLAADMAEVEQYLDVEYRKILEVVEELFHQNRIQIKDLMTTIFVAKYLEKMGDSLQNIAEVAISMAVGEQLKVHQIDNLDQASKGSKWAFRRAEGGISGSFTGIVEEADGKRYFYKEGSFKVIQDEITKSNTWNKILPGIVPAVHRSVFSENSEGYLMDYIEGQLIQDIYLEHDFAKKEQATKLLLATIDKVWEKTLKKRRPGGDYVQQIYARCKDLFSTHPELKTLRNASVIVGRLERRSLDDMLDLARTLQVRYMPEFSVYIHGDFNTNNIFYDCQSNLIRYIDVHRSNDGDYARDLATFMVSNLRHPMMINGMRQDAYRVNRLIYDFGLSFAQAHEDQHFEKRMQLLFARYLITSGRIFADYKHAKDLFLRGLFYLERFIE